MDLFVLGNLERSGRIFFFQYSIFMHIRLVGVLTNPKNLLDLSALSARSARNAVVLHTEKASWSLAALLPDIRVQ